MKISTRDGYFGKWHDYEIILPGQVINCKDAFGYDGFRFYVESDENISWLRIIYANLLQVKYMDRIYDMRKPKEYLSLKSILEAEITLASLDENRN